MLTDTQLKIAKLTAQGVKQEKIGEQLKMSSKGVAWHVRQVKDKLHLESIAGITRWAVSAVLVCLVLIGCGAPNKKKTLELPPMPPEIFRTPEAVARMSALAIIAPPRLIKTNIVLDWQIPDPVWADDCLLQVYGTEGLFYSWYPVTNTDIVPFSIRMTKQQEYFKWRWTNYLTGDVSDWSHK